MKIVKLFLIALLICSGFASNAQTSVWDSTFRPATFSIKREQFKSYKSSIKDIVFLGNSITANTDWQELLQSENVKNRGISGDITFGILERLKDITDTKPAKIFLLIGINDISRNIPDKQILTNYRKIVSGIRTESPNTKIYLHTLMPVNHTFEKFKNHYGKDEHILLVNEAIRKMADLKMIYVIDLYPHFLDENKRMKAELTHDGLHLTAAGYQVWAKLLLEGNYLK
ncbi:GDSL-type esterase/lipase family protein [Daejeonella sp.]|uniref:GDSL-type esterase/lipase family protein n=1 Tax=Daejeonella sp. TaxID=2805397 RepID=UPI0025C1DB85|nr:GDSL-type esterase/lipase family protein [Daejeonella sp.]